MRATQQSVRCEYCGKKLEVQDREGANIDGNRVVLEPDGTRRRACRACADELSTIPPATPREAGKSSEPAVLGGAA